MSSPAKQPSTDSERDSVALVIRSKYRADVLRALAGGPRVPSTLAKETGIDIAQVSRSLSVLREAELVVLAVPEESRKGRVYRVTERGEQVLRFVEATGPA